MIVYKRLTLLLLLFSITKAILFMRTATLLHDECLDIVSMHVGNYYGKLVRGDGAAVSCPYIYGEVLSDTPDSLTLNGLCKDGDGAVQHSEMLIPIYKEC